MGGLPTLSQFINAQELVNHSEFLRTNLYWECLRTLPVNVCHMNVLDTCICNVFALPHWDSTFCCKHTHALWQTFHFCTLGLPTRKCFHVYSSAHLTCSYLLCVCLCITCNREINYTRNPWAAWKAHGPLVTLIVYTIWLLAPHYRLSVLACSNDGGLFYWANILRNTSVACEGSINVEEGHAYSVTSLPDGLGCVVATTTASMFVVTPPTSTSSQVCACC